MTRNHELAQLRRLKKHIPQGLVDTFILMITLLVATGLANGFAIYHHSVRGFWPGSVGKDLTLALIPLVFAWLLRIRRWPAPIAWGLVGLWLLFFPNAPYMLTELGMRDGSWLTLTVHIVFAIMGLLVGLTSLMMIHLEAQARLGWLRGWLFMLLVSLASGAGVYLGRFLRFNSWDLFTDPMSIVRSIVDRYFGTSTMVQAWGFSLLFTALLLLCYVVVIQLGTLTQQRRMGANYPQAQADE
ncbi:MAG: DUF1361 domain-containing protein [Candidatus Promineifilaceae bacterium]